MRTFSAREHAWQRELDGIELAGFRRRAFALLFDSILVGIALSAVLTLIALGYTNIGSALGYPVKKTDVTLKSGKVHVNIVNKLDEQHVEHSLDSEVTHVLTDILMPVLYFGILLWRGKGQTPGKRLMKIRVVSIVHPHLSFWHSVERALGYGAAFLECGFGFVQYFIHPYRRCAQDRLAETIVVTELAYQKMLATRTETKAETEAEAQS